MEPLDLKSEDELYSYFKKFLKNQPKAVQLDGSTTPKANKRVELFFRYSVDGKKYCLFGDLTREAVETFVTLSNEHGSPAVALKEYSNGKDHTLILATSNEPGGWSCRPFVHKAQDKLKDKLRKVA